MTSYFDLRPNGTTATWRPKGLKNIFFKEQAVDFRGARKQRGGAPVCCPIFGTMPKTEHYENVDPLPQHGLVRTGAQDCQRSKLEHDDGTQLWEFIYLVPWWHKVWVTVKTTNRGHTLKHRISVQNLGDGDSVMPLSLGWHPYFATHDKGFIISHAGKQLTSEEIVEDEAVFVKLTADTPLILTLDYGRVIEMRLSGDYERFCIWTDAKTKYICVEPVMGGGGKYRLLHSHDAPVHCDCTLRVVS